MTCEEARELIGADPETASVQLLAHLNSCPECQASRERALALNAKIRQALELDWRKVQRAAPPPGAEGTAATTPQPISAALSPEAASAQPISAALPPESASAQPAPGLAAAGRESGAASRFDASNVTVLARRTPPSLPQHKRPRLLALAASLAAALVVGSTLWLSRPAASLASEIVTHVEGEPNSWSSTRPVGAEQLDAVLHKSGVKLGPGMQPVMYASSCWFRGHYVPHFVVATRDGPVTVMILRNETIPAARQFNEDGYSGLLVPARAGSVAVISRTPMALEKPASDVVRALQSAN